MVQMFLILVKLKFTLDKIEGSAETTADRAFMAFVRIATTFSFRIRKICKAIELSVYRLVTLIYK